MLSLLLTAALLQPLDRPGVEVVVFLGVECPLSRLYANRLNDWQTRYPGVRFLAVGANRHDTAEELAAFAREFELRVPFAKDSGQAAQLGATRNPEAFVLVNGKVEYRGRIDDRYAPGRAPRPKPSRLDLEIALEEVLSHRTVTEPVTEPVGCWIDSANPSEGDEVAYPQVAGILHKRCGECHRPGQVAPFSLLTYEEAAGWAATIREVIERGRMPPWGADPRYGKFVNDLSLTPSEKRLLLAWCDAGAPQGDPSLAPRAPTFDDGWKIGKPELVLTLAEPYRVPAEGIVDYQEFILDPQRREDMWIQAIEIRPSNRVVVHHVNTFVRPSKDASNDRAWMSPAGDVDLASYVPGHSVTSFREGIAKHVPAGWVIVLNIHYVTVGTPQEDRTSIAFKLIDFNRVTHEAATRKTVDYDLLIPPRSKTTTSASLALEDDYMLAAIYPHMHLRGSKAIFEAKYPSGELETLLDVDYDFNWQFRYVLAEPKPLPAGTILTFRGEFDNTENNPNNPDPDATVRYGKLTTDEMFNGMWDIYRPLPRGTPFNYARVASAFAMVGIVWFARRSFAARSRSR
ncbi:MAG TPA: thiol-disulfide isomerase [Pirellulales bacterium]|nr:thiol-disulfide isomerase [Pirellulales bacterium]